MDEKGYAFTPMVYLLFIPVMILAISYGNIVNEANSLAALATGGDVTMTAVSNIFTSIEDGIRDSGRSACFNATRKVIDNYSNNQSVVFFKNGTSKPYIKKLILNSLNAYVINASRDIENQTGREVYINNIPINNYTNATFSDNNISIYQNDPFGFYVKINQSIPIRVEQKGQVFTGKTPEIVTYVSFEGLEDPYIWVNTKARQSDVISKYSYATYSDIYGYTYFFDEEVNEDENKINFLWDCLNGTRGISGIPNRPLYFVNPYGLSFFDRLENRSVSAEVNNTTRMSTFVLGDPLFDEHGRADISKLDQDYFGNKTGTLITIKKDPFRDPTSSPFYLSNFYINFFGMKAKYT